MYPVYHLLMAGVIWGYIFYDHAAFESEQYDSKRPKVVLIRVGKYSSTDEHGLTQIGIASLRYQESGDRKAPEFE